MLDSHNKHMYAKCMKFSNEMKMSMYKGSIQIFELQK